MQDQSFVPCAIMCIQNNYPRTGEQGFGFDKEHFESAKNCGLPSSTVSTLLWTADQFQFIKSLNGSNVYWSREKDCVPELWATIFQTDFLTTLYHIGILEKQIFLLTAGLWKHNKRARARRGRILSLASADLKVHPGQPAGRIFLHSSPYGIIRTLACFAISVHSRVYCRYKRICKPMKAKRKYFIFVCLPYWVAYTCYTLFQIALAQCSTSNTLSPPLTATAMVPDSCATSDSSAPKRARESG